MIVVHVCVSLCVRVCVRVLVCVCGFSFLLHTESQNIHFLCKVRIYLGSEVCPHNFKRLF